MGFIWTTEAIARISAYDGSVSTRELARQIGCTLGQLCGMRHRLRRGRDPQQPYGAHKKRERQSRLKGAKLPPENGAIICDPSGKSGTVIIRFGRHNYPVYAARPIPYSEWPDHLFTEQPAMRPSEIRERTVDFMHWRAARHG